MGIIIGFFLALIVPLIFLGLVRSFDFYQTGQYHIVRNSLVWGVIAYAPATFTYSILEQFVFKNSDIIIHFIAPVYEEIFKGLILLHFIRHAKFTYSVDGALYGFAIGTGFAIIENIFYIFDNLTEAPMIAAQRIFSADLVHAFSSAALGIALGMYRSGTPKSKWWIPASGWLLAIIQHMIFNVLIGTKGIPYLIFFLPALPGFLFIYIMMRIGRKQAQGWIKEKLGMDVRNSRGEVTLVDRLANAGKSLLPVVERFGAEKTDQVEKLLYLQARLGIKHKALDGFQNNSNMYKALEAEITNISTEITKKQREIGTYAMLFIRKLFTYEMISVWDQMQAKIQARAAETGSQKGGGVWSILEERVDSATENERIE